MEAHEVAYLLEEMPIESGISVMDNVEGKAMLTKDMVLHELGEPLCCESVVCWCKMYHLCASVHYGEDGIMAVGCEG